MSSQFSLLRSRRFAPLFYTQFLGAFNDNTFKNALVVLLTFHAASWTELSLGVLANLAAGLFILPFFLFSASAGQLADKYDKARLARLVKGLEIIIALLAGLGFWSHSLALLLGALTLLGLHSTLFGPVKYALLPQHLKEEELLGGNALVEAGTFIAILLGTLAGGLLAAQDQGPAWITGVVLGVALVGYLVSCHIPPAPAPDPNLAFNPNPLGETWRNLQGARTNGPVFLAILGISWFWLYGALFLAQFPAYAKLTLGGKESAVTLLLALFTLGIGAGSLACDRLSRHRIDARPVLLGALGLSLFGVDFAWTSAALAPAASPLALGPLLARPGVGHVMLDLLALGFCGGLYGVPLYALMQQGSAPSHRARIVAANNILNALFMVAGALGAAALLSRGVSLAHLFGLGAVLNALITLPLAWLTFRPAPGASVGKP